MGYQKLLGESITSQLINHDHSHPSLQNRDAPRWNQKATLLLGVILVVFITTISCRLPLGRVAREAKEILSTDTPPALSTPPPAVSTAIPEPSGPPSQPTQGAEEAVMAAKVPPSFRFAVLNPVPLDMATAGNIEQIRTEFGRIKKLRISIVAQIFSGESTEADWRAYLDAAQQENLLVVPGFAESPPVWRGNDFDMGPSQVFLETMKDHPALYGFLLIDEPFHKKHNWDITADRLQLLYQEAKAIAPNVLIAVQFSREIQRAEQGRDPRFMFRSGMCDICIISALEFRNYGDGNRFYKDVLISNQSISRAVIKREAPEAQIWSTVQVFGSAQGKSSYYQPSVDELRDMVRVLLSPELQAAGALDGLLWQAWSPFLEAQTTTQLSLGSQNSEDLRNVVEETAQQLNVPPN